LDIFIEFIYDYGRIDSTEAENAHINVDGGFSLRSDGWVGARQTCSGG
jgi:hypothetical protein